jgi:hypothetical protein
MKNFIKLNLILVLLISLVWISCKTTKVPKVNYAGKYNYTITTPMGEQAGFIVLNRDGDKYTGQVGSDQGTTDLSNLIIEGTKMTANFAFMSYDISVKAELAADVIEGTFTAEGYDIPFKAIKVK